MVLLTKQFKALGVDITDVTPVMWSAFRREHLSDFPTLAEVVAYLQ